ncbi:hypothetical protein EK904_007535 [Melospiza melodia maxima]|nr:hypothetical protein EK904_007535 [Melospiza melodia maxima]
MESKENCSVSDSSELLSPVAAFVCISQPVRIVLISSRRSFCSIFSVLPYRDCTQVGDMKLDGGRQCHSTGVCLKEIIGLEGVELGADGKTVSYTQFLFPTNALGTRRNTIDSTSSFSQFRNASHRSLSLGRANSTQGSIDAGSDLGDFVEYDPNLLDDPQWPCGKHKRVLIFPSYMTTVIDYVKPSDLKKDMNETFKEKFPHIKLTLSKIRSLKREMRKLAQEECGFEEPTVAMAFVYFEKLALKGKLNKQNRKLCAGACVLLAAKIGSDLRKHEVKHLIDKLEEKFRLNRRELIAFEFPVLVALEFALHLPEHETPGAELLAPAAAGEGAPDCSRLALPSRSYYWKCKIRLLTLHTLSPHPQTVFLATGNTALTLGFDEFMYRYFLKADLLQIPRELLEVKKLLKKISSLCQKECANLFLYQQLKVHFFLWGICVCIRVCVCVCDTELISVQDWGGGGKEKSVHLNLPSITSHVAATLASRSQLQSEGREDNVTPSSSSSSSFSSFPWPPHSPGAVEQRAWRAPGACGCLAGLFRPKRHIAGEKQIVIATCRLKNDSLTVVFRDAIESSCHIFCLLCCYPALIYSLHRFLDEI